MRKKLSLKSILCSATLVLSFAATLALTSNAQAGQSLYTYWHGRPLFHYNIYNAGEKWGKESGQTSTWTLGKRDLTGLREATSYWGNIIGPKAANTDFLTITVGTYDEDNAYALSNIIQTGTYAGMTKLAAALVYGAKFDESAQIVIGLDPAVGQRYLGPIQVLTHNGVQEDMASTITHELGHALGMASSAFGRTSFGTTLSSWDNFLVDSFGTPASPGMRISGFTGSSPGDFILSDNSGFAFFQGSVVMEILGNAMLDPNGAVSGLPINGFEDGTAELSHIELKNSLMSHQNYRNYGIFMEAELAVLKDLGYNIDLKSQFGYSVYESGNTGIVNTTGFYDRNAEGTGWLLGVYNTSTGAVGLHVYGAYNTIIQAADILSAGPGSAGIRIDGHGYDSSSNEIFGNNHVTVAPGFKVHAHGQGGTGVMVTYGNGHTLVNRSEIAALGDGGIGVRFDFGDNELGNSEEYRGSYIWVDEDGNDNTNLSDEGLDGALVDRFDVTGTIAGRKAAIYISENALVEQINIMRGAQLYGDIISCWDPNDPRVQSWQIPGGNANSTLLTFGYEPDSDGEVTGFPDAAFSLKYVGNIIGRQGMSVQLAGGQLSWQGRMDVIDYTQDSGSTLRGIVGDRASVIRADDITIQSGAWLGVTDVPFQYGNVVDTGVMPVLHFDAPAYSQDGTLIEGTSGAFAMGAYDYTYANSRWFDSNTIGLDITSRRYNYERGGSSAVTAPLAFWAYNPLASIANRRGIELFAQANSTSDAGKNLMAWNRIGSFLNGTTISEQKIPGRLKINDVEWTSLTDGSWQQREGANSFWVKPSYGYTNQTGRAGYNIKGFGIQMGYDQWYNDNFFAGFALLKDYPEYDSREADVDARNTSGMLYGGLRLPNDYELGAFLSYGLTKHSQKRYVQGERYSSNYKANIYSLGINLGKSYKLSEKAVFRPFIGYDFSHLRVGSYSESLGTYALNFHANNYDLHRFTLGADWGWKFDNEAWASAGLYYLGTFGDRQGKTTAYFSMDRLARTFVSQGDSLDKHAFGLGIRAGLPLSKVTSFNAGYSFLTGKNTSSHLIELDFRYNF